MLKFVLFRRLLLQWYLRLIFEEAIEINTNILIVISWNFTVWYANCLENIDIVGGWTLYGWLINLKHVYYETEFINN